MSVRRARQLAVLGALAVALVVAAVVAQGEKSKPPTKLVASTASLAGLPQHGTAIGRPDAPQTLVEFADLKCPVCRAFNAHVMPSLLQKVRAGKLRIVLELQTFVGSPPGDSARAASAALVAGKRSRLWNFVELWYANQRDENTAYATDAYVSRIARAAGAGDVLSGRSSPWVTDALRASAQRFQANGFQGTPSFLLGPTGGKLKPVDPSRLAS